MKYILLMIAGFLACQIVWAQSEKTEIPETDTSESFSVFDKLYLELAGGSQILFSQDADILKIKDRLTPHAFLSLGTWFSHSFGVELNVQGAMLNGFTSLESMSNTSGEGFADDPVRDYVTIRPDGSYRHFVKYTNASVNLFASMANLFSRKKKEHQFDLIPSAGVGLMHVFEYKGIPENDFLSYNFGASVNCRISPRLKFILKGKGIMVPNEFEGRDAGDNAYDWIGSLDAGFVWYLRAVN